MPLLYKSYHAKLTSNLGITIILKFLRTSLFVWLGVLQLVNISLQSNAQKTRLRKAGTGRILSADGLVQVGIFLVARLQSSQRKSIMALKSVFQVRLYVYIFPPCRS
jgi:hypothetical protein